MSITSQASRPFSGIFSGVTVSAAQDFFELTAATTGNGIRVLRVEIAADSDETSQQLPMILKIGSGHTAGTGGSSVTPARLKAKVGGAASTATLARNNTTAAVAGGGTLTTIGRRPWNVVTAFLFHPTDKEAPTLAPGEAFIVNLPTAPGAGIALSGEIIWEELY